MNQKQALAHELTVEYIRANPQVLQDAPANISKIVDNVATINKNFLKAIQENTKFDNLM